LRLAKPLDDELDVLRLMNATEGIVIKRRETGVVTLAWEGRVYTVRQREWLMRPPIDEHVAAAWQTCSSCLDSSFYERIRSLMELCWYVLSPRGIGTSLVWFLSEPSKASLTPWLDLRRQYDLLGINLFERRAHSELVHLARHLDGAFAVGPKGQLIAGGAHLTVVPATEQLIGKYRGTRHTSARWYSYEHPETLVFTVSQDGSVTVFSDGAIITQSPVVTAETEAEGLKRSVPEKAEDVIDDRIEKSCSRCGKHLEIHDVTVFGWKERCTADCPVCGTEVYATMAWEVRAVVKKHLPS